MVIISSIFLVPLCLTLLLYFSGSAFQNLPIQLLSNYMGKFSGNIVQLWFNFAMNWITMCKWHRVSCSNTDIKIRLNVVGKQETWRWRSVWMSRFSSKAFQMNFGKGRKQQQASSLNWSQTQVGRLPTGRLNGRLGSVLQRGGNRMS